MNAKLKTKYALPAIGCLLLVLGFVAYYLVAPLSTSKQTEYLYIDNDDTVDSVYAKLTPIANKHGLNGLRTIIRHSQYPDNIRTGRYAVEPSQVLSRFSGN